MKLHVCLLVTLFACTHLSGGTIVVSADSNLGDAIDGSDRSLPGDNARFFSNLLGGSTSVVFQDTSNPDLSETLSSNAIRAYYSGLSGINETTLAAGSEITMADLATAGLFIGFLPDSSYSQTSLSAFAAFLDSGGTILFTGEFGSFDSVADDNINSALLSLGSSIRIVSTVEEDYDYHVAKGSAIHNDPLTAGVNSFSYAAASEVSGGLALFDTTLRKPFMSTESVTPVTFDVTPAPEPASGMLIFGVGLVFTGWYRRGKRSADTGRSERTPRTNP